MLADLQADKKACCQDSKTASRQTGQTTCHPAGLPDCCQDSQPADMLADVPAGKHPQVVLPKFHRSFCATSSTAEMDTPQKLRQTAETLGLPARCGATTRVLGGAMQRDFGATIDALAPLREDVCNST